MNQTTLSESIASEMTAYYMEFVQFMNFCHPSSTAARLALSQMQVLLCRMRMRLPINDLFEGDNPPLLAFESLRVVAQGYRDDMLGVEDAVLIVEKMCEQFVGHVVRLGCDNTIVRTTGVKPYPEREDIPVIIEGCVARGYKIITSGGGPWMGDYKLLHVLKLEGLPGRVFLIEFWKVQTEAVATAHLPMQVTELDESKATERLAAAGATFGEPKQLLNFKWEEPAVVTEM